LLAGQFIARDGEEMRDRNSFAVACNNTFAAT